jgi:sRNA-binding protein
MPDQTIPLAKMDDVQELKRGRRGVVIRALLAERFPKCFAAKGQAKRPLKIGIHADIRKAAPDISIKELNRGLFDYTAGPRYLEAMTGGAVRVDLDGNDAGTVTAEEAGTSALRARGMRLANICHNAIKTIAEFPITHEKENQDAWNMREIARRARIRITEPSNAP